MKDENNLTRAIRLPCVCELTGMARATIWRRCQDDPLFPRPYKLSPGITVWDLTEVQDYLEAKKTAARVK